MQILSGHYKHRPIESPNDPHTHPMGSREKLALFNIISSYLPNSTVLDAFAGSGALGLEALSRGARQVVFVEKSQKAAKVIKQNLANLGDEAVLKAQVITSPIEKVNFTTKFDLIFADPPYDHFDLNIINPLTQFLKPNGILVLSHPKLQTPPILPNTELISSRTYAAANISCFLSKSVL